MLPSSSLPFLFSRLFVPLSPSQTLIINSHQFGGRAVARPFSREEGEKDGEAGRALLLPVGTAAGTWFSWKLFRGYFSSCSLPPPPTGAALAPAEPKLSGPLHPGGYCWLVFTGEGGGDSSNFLFRDEILISLALSTLKVTALQTPQLLLGCS